MCWSKRAAPGTQARGAECPAPPTHPPHPLPLPQPQEFPWEGGGEGGSEPGCLGLYEAKSTRLLSV